MNANRRKALSALSAKLDEIADKLDDLAFEEEEAADMIPESFEERKSEMEDNVGYIQEASETVRSAIELLEEIEGVT